MHLEFTLNEADLVALAKHHMEHSPTFVRRYRIQRYGLTLGLAALAALSHFVLHKPAVALYFAALTLTAFMLYPLYHRWLTAQTLRRIVGARLNPAAFAPRTVRAAANGLEQAAAGKQALTPWAHVGGPDVTANHAFIALNGIYSIVIPRNRVDEAAFQSFLEAVRTRTAA